MNALLRSCSACALIFLAVSAVAAPRSSSSYALPTETLDGGGSPAASTIYHQTSSSMGLPAGMQASAAYSNTGGFLAAITAPHVTVPTVSTLTSAGVTSSSATLGGSVTSDGGSVITGRGVVYSKTADNNNPLIGDGTATNLTAGGTTGVFTVNAASLTPGTSYTFKAYATNSEGTTYTTVATFTTQSTNADLIALTLSSGTLSPAFASAATGYATSVSNATTSVTVTPTRAQANATIETRVNGGSYTAVTSGSPSETLALNVGSNTVEVRVTAQDGTTTRTYTVAVTRQSVTENALENWAAEKGLPPSAAGPLADADGDGVPNLMEFAFGTSPSTSSLAPVKFSGSFANGVTMTQPGQPVVAHESAGDDADIRAVFVRLSDHEAVGLTYSVKFSADLVTWETSTVTPTVLGSDGIHEAVSVPYPPAIGGKKARFFTVGVDAAP